MDEPDDKAGSGGKRPRLGLRFGDASGTGGAGSSRPASIRGPRIRKEGALIPYDYDFNDDILKNCFSFLTAVDLCKAALVCRQWSNVSQLPEFWKELNFEGRRVSPEQVVSLCRRYPGVQSLSLRGVLLATETQARDALRPLRDLRSLVLGHRLLGDSVLTVLASGECPRLERIKISDAVLGGAGPQDVTLAHGAVVDAAVTGCRVSRLAINCGALVNLSLHRTAAAAVVLACPRLTKLDLSHCQKLTDSAVRTAAISCQALNSLDLSNCSSVSDDTLREVASSCPQLAELNISGCSNLTLEGVRFLSLTRIVMAACDGVTAASMSALSHFTALEECVADGCALLAAATLSLPRLRSLSVRGCRKLVDIEVDSPLLVAVDVGALDSGGACSSLRRARVSSAAVTSLRWRGLLALEEVSLQCPSLQELDLSECDALRGPSVFAAAGEGGGCPQLRVLALESCEGLVGGQLKSGSLVALRLSGCKGLRNLELACPELRALHLDGCDRLQSAVLAPIGVAELNLGICPRLEQLTIQSTSLRTLELRGSGALKESALDCPGLRTLDASYCARLDDSGLEETARLCGALETLRLAACPLVGASAFRRLAPLRGLQRLDLSYTEVTDLAPVLAACPALRTLQLSACKRLRDGALTAVLGGGSVGGGGGGGTLRELRELDVSYCNLGVRACADILLLGRQLESVSMNGCSRVTCELWPMLLTGAGAGAPGAGAGSAPDGDAAGCGTHSLTSLSCVGCDGMRSADLPLGAPALANLASLSLRLSAVQRVRVPRFPRLTSLNVSDCASLASLDIDCPTLGALYVQACPSLAADAIRGALRGLGLLETLDVRDVALPADLSDAGQLRAACPSLRRLFRSAEPTSLYEGLL